MAKDFKSCIGKIQCKQCLFFKPRIRGPLNRHGKFLYIDESGLRWRGRVCRDCDVKNKLLHERLKGVKGRDDSKCPSHQKGRSTEWEVFRILKERGLDVELNHGGTGPDLFWKNKETLLKVEIKTILKMKNVKTWYVPKVRNKRINDDFVVLYFEPKKHIFMQTMKEHLNACTASGSRTVTKLVQAIV